MKTQILSILCSNIEIRRFKLTIFYLKVHQCTYTYFPKRIDSGKMTAGKLPHLIHGFWQGVLRTAVFWILDLGFFSYRYLIIAKSNTPFPQPPSPFNLTACISHKHERTLKEWIRRGSQSRLQIRTTFSEDLGLPPEARLCSNKTGNWREMNAKNLLYPFFVSNRHMSICPYVSRSVRLAFCDSGKREYKVR